MNGKMQGGFRGGRKRQGGWVIQALQAAAGLAQAFGAGQGAANANKGKKNQKNALRYQNDVDLRNLTQEKDALLGVQQADYAASGVDVGVGSVSAVMNETRDEYTRAVAANEYLTRAKMKGASTEAKTAQYSLAGNFFSGVSSFGQGVHDANKAIQDKGWGSFW